MSKLDDLITNATTGEAPNYAYSINNLIELEFKQTFEVTQENFKWKVKSAIFVKMLEDTDPTYDGVYYNDIALAVGDRKIYLSTGTSEQGDLTQQALTVNKNTGVTVNGTVISQDVWNFTKILEHEFEFDLSRTGRYGVKLRVFQYKQEGYEYPYYFTDYTDIYLTLPSYSGMYIKINNIWDLPMPYIKVNGEWKPALQYIKINGEWKLYHDTWQWIPEGS